MTSGSFTSGAEAVLTELASVVPFPMWVVSRKSGDDYVVLSAHDRQYGLVQGDVLPWSRTLCARMVDGSAPCASGDISTVPAFLEAAADLRMDIGAYITVPLRSATGELYGTLCGADPTRHTGPLDEELAHVRGAAQVLTVLLEQQLRLDRVMRRSDVWEQQATRDPLTGLGNRRLWDELVHSVEDQRKALGSSAVVAVLDLDALKVVNEQLGHAAGDALLRSTGEVLRGQLKAGDVVARTGGDEFSIVLVDVDETAGRAVAERLRRALADVDVDVSVGVCATRHDRSVSAAWQLAQAEMHRDMQVRSALPARLRSQAPAAAEEPHRPGMTLDASIGDLLHEVREALGLPVAYVSRFAGDHGIIEAVDATCPVPFAPGDTRAAEDTYCRRIVDGKLPQAIPNTSANSVAAALPITRELGIGSYVGVPILLPDGTVYGAVCAYAPDARPVDDRDTAMLHLVARSISVHLFSGLEQWQNDTAIRERIAAVVAADEIVAVYQPIVDLGTGTTSAVEALARFPQSWGRRPDQWFQEAAAVGEAATLELAAAAKAVTGLPALPAHVSLTINVSPAVAVRPQFVQWLMGQPLDRLVLELTEHEQIEDYETLNRLLAPARARGLRLAVDDAGAGYASLRHSLLLKPDLLKLDISLVRDCDTDPAKRALCRAVITFAHTTGARVIAEGIETSGEMDTMRRLGADYGQGYFLQRPAALEDLDLPASAAADERRRASGDAISERTLQTISEMQQAGCSPATIAARLNSLGELQPGGARWQHRAVAAVLRAQTA